MQLPQVRGSDLSLQRSWRLEGAVGRPHTQQLGANTICVGGGRLEELKEAVLTLGKQCGYTKSAIKFRFMLWLFNKCKNHLKQYFTNESLQQDIILNRFVKICGRKKFLVLQAFLSYVYAKFCGHICPKLYDSGLR
jgi:hypothetical protein